MDKSIILYDNNGTKTTYSIASGAYQSSINI